MEGGNAAAPFQARSLEPDKIRIVGERAGEGCGIARVPASIIR